MRPSVLVTRRIYPEAIELLKKHAEVDYNSTDDILSRADLIERARGKTAIVSQLVDKFTRDVLAELDVKLIANVAVGFDNIDVAAATERGILVSNTPDVLTDTTADFAFALLMATARRVVEAHQFVHAGKWQRWAIDMLVGQDVHHKTLGVLGMGRIGEAMARRSAGFEMRVLYSGGSSERYAKVSKEELLRESDFVSLHVPLSDATRHYIGERELRMMKPTSILINTARGPVVDEAALVRALREGWIGGAGIDVFEREPQIDPGLLNLPNAVLAPHIGSASVDTRRGMSMIAAQNAVDAIEGRRPRTLLNPLAWRA
jgi:lactate dehydrogenase-like 2-hydroxyacid dehydrogenase